MTSVDVYYPVNCYQPVDTQISIVCSTCNTQVLCHNSIDITDCYFMCNHCINLNENLKNFDNRLRTFEGRMKGQKISSKINFLDNYTKELSKKIESNEKLTKQLTDSITSKDIKLNRKEKFNTRVRNLEILIFWDKIINFRKDKTMFDNYLIKNNEKIESHKLKFKRQLLSNKINFEKIISDKYNKAKITFKEVFKKIEQHQQWITERDEMIKTLLTKNYQLEEEIKTIKHTNHQILPTMKDQTLYIEETYKDLKEKVLKVEQEIEETRPKSKDYKDLRKLRHDLAMKDGEYNRFKKLMATFNFKVKALCFIIGLNVIAIFYLLAHIYFNLQ